MKTPYNFPTTTRIIKISIRAFVAIFSQMRTFANLLIILSLTLFSSLTYGQINTEKYLWEYPSHSGINAPQEIIDKLRAEVQKVIDTGFLRPLSIRYTDQMWETYIIYREPGRMLQTLAEAYPFLTHEQQQEVKLYANQLFTDPVQRFWIQPSYTNSFVPADYGIPRNLNPSENVYGNYEWWGSYRPTIQMIYAVWNYMYRTGDTSLITNYYENIRNFYELKQGYWIDPGSLYGTMNAHIGMARLAWMMDDQDMFDQAVENLEYWLNRGLNITSIDSMAFYGKDGWNAPYSQYCDNGEYCWRKDDYIYRGFIYLNLSPEMGRFLHDHVYAETVARNEYGKSIFPFWWVVDSPHWSRWAGDETVGIPAEMFGMVLPVEKWVKNTSGAELEQFFISSPKGIGDCYWLEGLVLAIEAFGTDQWNDIRTTPFSATFSHTQVINLPQGWSGVSANLIPTNPDIETLMEPVVDNLIILQNQNQVYWPSQQINTIGEWDFQKGYMIKMENAATLNFAGTPPETTTLALVPGWNLIPVLSECNVEVDYIYSQISGQIVVIKEVAGNRIYWPEYGITTLATLVPGNAYWFLMSEPGNIQFQLCD